jgi:hypothetical protein
MSAAAENGYSIGYILPAIGWMSLLKLFPSFGLPCDIVSYDCFGISLIEKNTFINSDNGTDISISLINKFSPEYDLLWNESISGLSLECAIVRSSAWLQYKLGGHSVFEVRKGDKLFGYVAIKSSGLLVDVFARSIADMQTCLQSVIKSIHQLNPEKIQTDWKEIKGMFTPTIQLVLSAIKFEMINFQFAFGYGSLDNNIPTEKIAPQRWFIMPDD